MTGGLARRSPLDGLSLPPGIREVPFLAQLNLRVDPTDASALAAAAGVLGFGLPVEPNGVSGSGAVAALWLGPDEWLVVASPGKGEDLEQRLGRALGGSFRALVDVSASRTTLELCGPSARAALESGCPIDLHPRVFRAGQCAQTLVARASVILWQLTEEPRYRLLVRPSFAAYVAAWLTDAVAAADA